MAPRKPKAQMSSSQSSRTTRGKRKLNESPESAEEKQTSHEQRPTTPAKRRKQAATSSKKQAQSFAETSIEDTLDEFTEPPEAAQKLGDHDVTSSNHQGTAIDARHVQFSNGVDDEAGVVPGSSTSLIVSKMSIKRRHTLSPNTDAEVMRYRRASGRQSLPAANTTNGTPLRMVPLHDVLEPRMRRILLDSPLKADERGASIDSTTLGDMMVIDSQLEPLASGSMRLDAPKVETSSSPAQIQDVKENVLAHSAEQWASERQRLHNTVHSLRETIEHLRSDSELYLLELQSLVGADEDHNKTSIIGFLRESFDQLREALYVALPTSQHTNLDNGEMLQLAVVTLTELSDRVTGYDVEFDRQADLLQALQTQDGNLLDGLAHFQVDNKRLDEQRAEAIEEAQHLRKELDMINKALATVEQEMEQLENERDVQIADRDTEIELLRRGTERLKKSLRGHHEDEQKMQDLIARLEEDHESAIVKIATEREKTVREHEDLFDDEVTARLQAELLARQRAEQVTQLEHTVEKLSEERTALLKQVNELKEDLQDQEVRSKEAEANLQMYREEAEMQAEQDKAMRRDADIRRVQIEELQTESEATLEDLKTIQQERDTAHERIEDLEAQLHETGLDANKLRQKMFEVQQQFEGQLTQIKQDAVDREESLQEEIELRNAAEQAVDARVLTINALERGLQEAQQTTSAIEAELKKTVQELEYERDHKRFVVINMNEELAQLSEDRQNESIQAVEARRQYEHVISGLEEANAKDKLRIIELTQENESQAELNDREINEREAALTVLQNETTQLKAQLDELHAEKIQVEQRVVELDDEMLRDQAKMQDQVDTLYDLIEDKQQKIQKVEDAARDADSRWEELLAELRRENEEKTELIAMRDEEILQSQSAFDWFVTKVEGSSRFAVNASADTNHIVQRQFGMLQKEVQEFRGKLEHASVKRATESRQRKQRAYDSGVGVGSDELEDAMTA